MYSQACQDLFVLQVLKEKQNGIFIEIGSNHPITHNNTFLLESKYNWSGLLVEYDHSFERLYQQHRTKSKYIINDAQKIDYLSFLQSNNFPINIDYLQIDLDVNNKSTLNTLELLDQTVFDTYKFAVITFEHDIYTGNYFNTQQISREIFSKRGYILVAPNISVHFEGRDCIFEDWYVHPDLVDQDYIKKITVTDSMNCEKYVEFVRLISQLNN